MIVSRGDRPTPSAPDAVCVTGVTRSFGPLTALEDVALRLRPGAVGALLGPNGAGKTTLLHIIATLLRPDRGSVFVDGLDAHLHPAQVRARIGLVGHRPMMYPSLRVEDNLRFFAALHGVEMDEAQVRRTLGEVGLLRRRRDRVGDLSRGLTQRLSIARAMAHRPSLLLLDEPFSGLDPSAVVNLSAALTDLSSGGAAVMFTSHHVRRSMGISDRIWMLRAGRVRWSGPAAGFPASDHFPDGALASAPFAVAPGDIHQRSTGAGHATDVRRADDATPVAASAEAPGPRTGERVRQPGSSDRRPMSIAATAALVCRKDVRSEVRAREMLPPTVVFALLAVVLQGQAFAGSASERAAIAPSALWVAVLLGSTLGLARTMAAESDSGGLTGMLVTPADRGGIFLGKWLAAWGFTTITGWLTLPVVVALHQLSLSWRSAVAIAALILLGTAGWAAAGVLLSAAAASARAREILLPVLLFPIALPLLLPVVRLTSSWLTMDGPWAAALALIVAYDVIYITAGFLLFPLMLAE